MQIVVKLEEKKIKIKNREVKANELYASDFGFGRVVRVVERYWEAGPSKIYIT